jgi:tyrosyl-tRNA synthetase
MSLLDLLKKRGLIEALTHEEMGEALKKPQSVYIGFDPTADSLHLGNLIGLIALRWFQKFGHRPVALVGGATGRIGDPSGKSKERPMLQDEEISLNVEAISRQIRAILPPQGGELKVLNNNDWLSKVFLIDFLRDVGKHFRIGAMLGKESVRMRLDSEEGMSFTEFSYQLLQGYDFVHLSRNHQVRFQMGGSDQWTNITAGIELNRRLGGEPIYGLTFPLLTRSDGKKFGKSEGGAIWLSKDKLSCYEFYQYLLRLPDADMEKMLRMLTFLEMEEIEEIVASMQRKGYVPNSAQKRLALEVTGFVHGEAGVAEALAVTEKVQGPLSSDGLSELQASMPSVSLSQEEIVGGRASDLLAKAGLTESKGEAARLIKNGGASLNQKRIEDPNQIIQASDLIDGKFLLLSQGKKKKILVVVC